MSTRNAGLTGLSNVQQQSNDANRDLLSMNAQQKQINEKALMGARKDVAGYEDKVFQTNQMQPYLDMMQGAQAMKGAGIQNIMGGVQAGAAMGMDYLKYKNFMDSMFPGDTTTEVDISPEVSEVIGNSKVNNDPSLEYTPSGSNVLTKDPTVGYKSPNEFLRGLGLNTGIYGGLKKR
jgi:hypothetical protein